MHLYLSVRDAIIRHFSSNEFGPFDRFVELGVFLVVGYEVIATFLNSRSEKRRKKEVTERSETIRKFISRGHGLGHDAHAFVEQRNLPWFLTPEQWIEQFDDWHGEIQLLFMGKSERGNCYPPQTMEAYMRNVQQRVDFEDLPTSIWPEYKHLQLRLENLRNIMEKPDVYL